MDLRDVMAIKSHFTAEQCQRITLAIIDDGRSYFDNGAELRVLAEPNDNCNAHLAVGTSSHRVVDNTGDDPMGDSRDIRDRGRKEVAPRTLTMRLRSRANSDLMDSIDGVSANDNSTLQEFPPLGSLSYLICFPIPVFCLVLLSLIPPRRYGNSYYLAPRYRKVERMATNFVGRIFFTPVTSGMSVRLVYFVLASLAIFVVATRTIRAGFDSAHIPCSGLTRLTSSLPRRRRRRPRPLPSPIARTSCHFHSGETMWYRRASRYRAERNFWLSLFTLVLWLLVYDIYALKRQIVGLRGAGRGGSASRAEEERKAR
ncbi:hypothetical protein ACHAW5_007465 [Stephanodiscus triporus]|uniref:Uncharacterized protein n=1 Tax=Stephanodiscus triporus TaxID=2934178 RepID=A0ABD3MUT5_9STRA